MSIQVNKFEKVIRISFASEKANALTSSLLNELESAFLHASADPDVVAIGLESLGAGAFCAGASFDELKQLSSETDAQNYFLRIGQLLLMMARATQFVVIRVHGKVVGGGVGLIAAGDYAIASTEAEVRLSELSIGLGPFVIGPFAERKLGKAAFQQLTLQAVPLSASWAEHHGLYSRLTPSRESLQNEYENELKRVSGFSRAAVTETKRMFWEDLDALEQKLPDRARTVARLLMKAQAERSGPFRE